MIKVIDAHFRYGQKPVLKGISLDVRPGALCGLFGPNGCGKTTLFRCCMNFLKIQQGRILIGEADIARLSFKKLARLVAYVPQEHRSPFPYRVREVVLMGRNPHASPVFGITRRDRLEAGRAIELLDLQDVADRPYNELSGGQRQMVLIARALAQDTRLILLDEPTSALDFSNQIRIWRIIRRVVRQGITVLACSHDPNHVSWFCDRVIVMDADGIVAEGPPTEVITEPILNRVYPGTCRVRELDTIPLVTPMGLERNDIDPPH
jgi:iron complex transport system ATP-binding protein